MSLGISLASCVSRGIWKALEDEVKEVKEKMASQEQGAKEKDEFFKKQLEDLEADWKVKIGKVRDEVNTQSNTIAESKAAVGKKHAEIEELKVETAMGLLRGFTKAEDQVKFLYPNLDISPLSVYKVIFDGELVEISSSDEDDADVEGVGDVSKD